MVKIVVDISDESNKVVEIVKAVNGFSNKADTIDFLIKKYGKAYVEEYLNSNFNKKKEKRK
jgi:hypothetical protein